MTLRITSDVECSLKCYDFVWYSVWHSNLTKQAVTTRIFGQLVENTRSSLFWPTLYYYYT